MIQDIVLATGNAGKVREIQNILCDCNVNILPQSQFDVPEAVEDGLTFVENALIKARHASKLTGLPAIADDSGIEVDYINGQPGIHSSRYAGESGNNKANNAKLLDVLSGVERAKRTARFQCVIVFLKHEFDPTPLICQGTWEGIITETEEGHEGFGYDPLFFVESEQCTSAQLDPALKNRISHRGKALKVLVSYFNDKRVTE